MTVVAAQESTWEKSNLRRAVVFVVALKILGLVLIFDFGGALNPFELPKTVFSRSTEWVLLALLAIAFARYGRAIVPVSRLHLALLGLVVANVVAAVFAEDRYIALYGTQERLLGLFFVVDMALLYLAVAVSVRRLIDWVVLAAAFAIASLGAAAYAVVQALGLDPMLWATNSQVRPFSTLGNPNMLGHFLSLVFAAGLAVLVLARRPVAFLIGGAVALGAVAVSAVVATRGSALGLPAAVAAGCAIYVSLHGVRKRTLLRVALPLVAVATIFTLVALRSPLGDRLRLTIENPSEGGAPTLNRVLVFESAARAFADRPLVGWGPDNFGVAFPRYRPSALALLEGPGPRNNSAHNWVLQAAATTGIIGALALLVLIGGGFWILLKYGLSNQPEVAVPLLVGSAAYWAEALVTVGTPGVDWFPWVVWGGAASLGAVGTAPSRRQVPRAGLVAAVAFALIFSTVGFNVVLANRAARAAKETTDTGLVAHGAAEEAVARDPGRADYWNELGRARFAARDLSGAEAAFMAATARAPYEAGYWSNLAFARASRAPTDRTVVSAALDAARRGVATDVNDPVPRIALAEVALAVGANQEALEAAVRAIQLYPPEPRYDQLAARAALGMTDLAEARSLLRPALDTKDTAVLRVAIAKISLALRDLPAARADALRALQLDPNNADAKSVLAATGG